MTAKTLCRSCGGTTEDGFVAATIDLTTTLVFWGSGQPTRKELSRGMAMQQRTQQPLIARRCGRCGEVTFHVSAEASGPPELTKPESA